MAILCTGLISLLSFVCASDSDSKIIFHPGLNVFSTPAIIDEDHGLEFSNGGQGISFATLINGKRAPITPNNTNIKPLEGYLVRNDTENDVTLSIDYDGYLEETDNLLSRELTGGWNLVGVTSTSNPFQNIANAEITTIVDFTNSANSNIVETTKTYNNDETFRDNFIANLGKAYAVFVNKNGGIFGGVNNTTSLPDNNSSHGNHYSEELVSAYNWAHENGITTMSSIDNANMYGTITRAEMAKMLANYAKNLFGREPDETLPCYFTDTASVQGDLATAIVEACQLGIMGQRETEFRPYDLITRAEFGTYLSRVLWGAEFEGGTPYYAKHLDALKAAGIINQITNAESTKEVRGYVFLTLQRAHEYILAQPTEECDAMAQLICSKDPENALCPEACKMPTLKNTLTKPVPFSGGEINRKVVFDGTFTAADKDITLTGFYFDGVTNLGNGIDATLYLSINGEEAGDVDLVGKRDEEKGSLSNILVKAGESINIKIDAEIYASTIGNASDEINRVELHLVGTDTDENDIDVKSNLININITRENKVHVVSTGNDTVLLSLTGLEELARFTVSKNNSNDDGILESFRLHFETVSGENINLDDLIIFVDQKGPQGSAYDDYEYTGYPDFKMKGDDVEIVVYLKDKKFKGVIETTLLDVNGFLAGGDKTISFKKRFEDALVSISSQSFNGDSNTYTLSIDPSNNGVISNLILYSNGDIVFSENDNNFNDGDEIEIIAGDSTRYIDKISYDYTLDGTTTNIEISKEDYNDYFKIWQEGGEEREYRKIEKSKDN